MQKNYAPYLSIKESRVWSKILVSDGNLFMVSSSLKICQVPAATQLPQLVPDSAILQFQVKITLSNFPIMPQQFSQQKEREINEQMQLCSLQSSAISQ